ncbi:unnamed protein product, partial [marine sediment metagenome]
NECGQGKVVTRVIDGKCLAVSPRTGKPISEKQRIKGVLG